MSDYAILSMILLVPLALLLAAFFVVGSTGIILLWLCLTPVSLGWFIVACLTEVTVLSAFVYVIGKLR